MVNFDTDRSFPAADAQQKALRYGENPHQEAKLVITDPGLPGAANATILQGKPLSYNNLADADAAYRLVAEFPPDDEDCAIFGTCLERDVPPSGHLHAAAIIKHGSPCGAALGPRSVTAYQKALSCDPISAFGGVLAFNATVDEECARQIIQIFTEIVIAPKITERAREVFATQQNLRVLECSRLPETTGGQHVIRSLAGALLVQTEDNEKITAKTWKCATKLSAATLDLADLTFALRVARHARSNAIILARKGATVGIGAGQTSRLEAARQGIERWAEWQERQAQTTPNADAGGPLTCICASDAFFPFPDAMLLAAKAGACSFVAPGGSRRDEEVIKAADNAGICLLLTPRRYFRH